VGLPQKHSVQISYRFKVNRVPSREPHPAGHADTNHQHFPRASSPNTASKYEMTHAIQTPGCTSSGYTHSIGCGERPQRLSSTHRWGIKMQYSDGALVIGQYSAAVRCHNAVTMAICTAPLLGKLWWGLPKTSPNEIPIESQSSSFQGTTSRWACRYQSSSAFSQAL
jgi:hypothetical protein